MQPPKEVGFSLVKMLFHICFLNKIIIKKILHTDWFTFSIGFGGSVADLGWWCTLHVQLCKSTSISTPH